MILSLYVHAFLALAAGIHAAPNTKITDSQLLGPGITNKSAFKDNITAAGLTSSQLNSFVTVSGTQLILDGKAFFPAGTNSYSISYLPREEVDMFFQDVVATGGTVVRTWLFADSNKYPASPPIINGKAIWYQDIDPSTGQMYFNDDSETGIARFDYVMKSARDHGVKLIVCLTNNWIEFGGIDVYVDRIGSPNKYHSDFFSMPEIKAQFKNYINYVMNRRNSLNGIICKLQINPDKEDPVIMAIELGNEFRCVGSNRDNRYPQDPKCTPKMITSWIDEMSAFLKLAAPKQLCAIGDEGFPWLNPGFFNGGVAPYEGAYSNIYDGSTGMDFIANAKLQNVDILGAHAYFDHWGNGNTPQFIKNTVRWIQDHASIAQQIGKPFYIGEYGQEDPNLRAQNFPIIQAQVENLGIAGDFTWIMQSTQFGAACSSASYTYCANDQNINTIFMNHAKNMKAKSG